MNPAIQQGLLIKILSIPGILLAFTIHNFFHALVADKLGDKTPRFNGKLTLNPLAHIDPVGFIMIILIGFGWTAPVPTNSRNLRRGVKDEVKVEAAGILGNLVGALFCALCAAMIQRFIPLSNVSLIFINIFYMGVSINCMLALFNLLPIPGLDGFNIVKHFFPKFFYTWSDFVGRYYMVILIAIAFAASKILILPTNLLVKLFNGIAGLIFGV